VGAVSAKKSTDDWERVMVGDKNRRTNGIFQVNYQQKCNIFNMVFIRASNKAELAEPSVLKNT
jgi:hypothetical protein